VGVQGVRSLAERQLGGAVVRGDLMEGEIAGLGMLKVRVR
jgi:hypothetical protein